MWHPSWSHEKIQGYHSLFLQPWLPGCLCAQMVGNGWLQTIVTQIPVATRIIISVCYQLQIAHRIFLCYLILSIPGPDPIKIPSSIYITETHPNLNKSLFCRAYQPCLLWKVALTPGWAGIFCLPDFPMTFQLKLSLCSSCPKILCASTMHF